MATTRISSPAQPRAATALARLVGEHAQTFDDIETADLNSLLDRAGAARVVLLGEATHGTSEFYRMRARITKELIVRHGFTIVAVEADWPDAHRIDRYARHLPAPAEAWTAFARFPTWMWRNADVLEFVEWLRAHNASVPDAGRCAGFFGLDLYSLYASLGAVLQYLDKIDPATAAVARERYGCLTPWQHDPAVYGHAAVTGAYETCEAQVVAILGELLQKQLDYSRRDGEAFLDAVQNARLVANAERYYRVMYYGSVESWNLRDQHMFDTLLTLLSFHGPDARAVVWEHNSHIGNASATEMGTRGEFNVGQLCRERFGADAWLVGFGTDHGTVAAATDWDGPMDVKKVRPSHRDSYERLCHDAGRERFILDLAGGADVLRDELAPSRLERAIGVIYRPQTELMSHYFHASLPQQFDSWIWFDESHAVTPLGAKLAHDVPDTYPFGL